MISTPSKNDCFHYCRFALFHMISDVVASRRSHLILILVLIRFTTNVVKFLCLHQKKQGMDDHYHAKERPK